MYSASGFRKWVAQVCPIRLADLRRVEVRPLEVRRAEIRPAELCW